MSLPAVLRDSEVRPFPKVTWLPEATPPPRVGAERQSRQDRGVTHFHRKAEENTRLRDRPRRMAGESRTMPVFFQVFTSGKRSTSLAFLVPGTDDDRVTRPARG